MPTTPITSYTYSLDPTGNRTKVDELGGVTTEWTYDNLYRLTCETHTAALCTTTSLPGTTRYEYDLVGNRKTLKQGSTITTSSFNALDQLQTSTTNGLNTTYSYDGHGNLNTVANGSGTTTYAYDAQDRLVNAAMPSGTNDTFAYDADGHRINQTAGAQATKYLWDTLSPYGDVIRETDGTGNQTAAYTLGGMELLSQTRGGNVSFYLHDGQGSTRNLINTSGTVTDSYVYDAFGNGQHTAGATVNAYQYTGQQFDAATGLYDLRARYYDPGSGRFTRRDMFNSSLDIPQEFNRYVYARNSAINRIDPEGKSSLENAIVQIKLSASNAAIYFFTNGTLEAWLLRTLLCVKIGFCTVANPLGDAEENPWPQDNNANPLPPEPNLGEGNIYIGHSENQFMQMQADIDAIKGLEDVTDIRVNQQQVAADNERVGINRPDLQYTYQGRRYYIEYEHPSNPRGFQHAARILANDPDAVVTIKLIPDKPDFTANVDVTEIHVFNKP